jgi:hypothetical protein
MSKRSATAADVRLIKSLLEEATGPLFEAELVMLSGLRGPAVRRAIRMLNFLGEPVVSSPAKGFWLAATGTELRVYALELEERADRIRERAAQIHMLANQEFARDRLYANERASLVTA